MFGFLTNLSYLKITGKKTTTLQIVNHYSLIVKTHHLIVNNQSTINAVSAHNPSNHRYSLLQIYHFMFEDDCETMKSNELRWQMLERHSS